MRLGGICMYSRNKNLDKTSQQLNECVSDYYKTEKENYKITLQ